MTGLFNRNPTKPKYVDVCDVEEVLTYIKGLPKSTKLSDKILLLKLTVLLFIFTARRCHETCYHDMRYMGKV